MAVSNKKRDSLAGPDASLTGRVLRRTEATVDSVLPTDLPNSTEPPPRDALNKLLLALGVRALITGIALTIVSPTLPVFVGVNVLMGTPVLARYVYKRRTTSTPSLRRGSKSRSSAASIAAAIRAVADRSSSGRDRL